MATALVQEECFTIEIERQAHDSYEILEHMQKEHLLCDVTLVAKDLEIPAHKNILASCSPYFYSMFTNSHIAKQEKIPLDVNPQILLSIVNYMYTSKLTVLEQNLMDVIEVSKMLLLNRVHVECCNLLMRIISPNNCFYIKTVATTYGQSGLLNNISSFIDNNFDDITASEEFLSLTSNEISELISRNSLKVSSEEKVYECVVRWINHDPKERRKLFRHLMQYVKFGFISKNYLKEHIAKDQFLRRDNHCMNLIFEALLEDGVLVPKIKPRCYKEEGKVLLVVGGEGEEAFNNLQYYDLKKNCWSEILETPFSIFNAELVVVNQKVYVIGGYSNGKAVQRVNCYDININNWENICDMTRIRHTHAVAVLNNCIYVVGGSYSQHCLNSAEKFDIQTQKWSSIAPMLTERRFFGMSVLNDILYVVGGYSNSFYCRSSVLCYNHRIDAWKESSNLNYPRWGLGVCTLDGKLYAIGGRSEQKYFSTVEEYNPDIDEWTIITPMNVSRALFGTAVLENKIYVTGGCNDDGDLNSIEVYDNVTKSWMILPEVMNVARSNHGAVIINKAI